MLIAGRPGAIQMSLSHGGINKTVNVGLTHELVGFCGGGMDAEDMTLTLINLGCRPVFLIPRVLDV